MMKEQVDPILTFANQQISLNNTRLYIYQVSHSKVSVIVISIQIEEVQGTLSKDQLCLTMLSPPQQS